MKNLVTIIMMSAFLFFSVDTSAQIEIPKPSPKGTVSTVVGMTTVEISYYRPQTKGRSIFGNKEGSLVPYGKLWRTGANSGTIVSVNTPVEVAGKPLEAGEYLLLSIPGELTWTFMFHKNTKIGGRMSKYDAANDAISITVPADKLTEKVSTLTINISDLSEDSQSANIQFAWENTSVNIPFKVSFDEQIMASIAKHTVVDPNNLIKAAQYYLKTGKDMKQALTWVDAYLSGYEEKPPFWHLHTKALILAEMENKKEAIKVAKLSSKLAKENEGGDYGYVAKNKVLIESLR